jgi:diguanylate cyclase (GGDEF)-like protein
VAVQPERSWRGGASTLVRHDRQPRQDALTGLSERHHFLNDLERLLDSESVHDASHALVLIDIDHFTGVNHSLGYAVGDQYLTRVSRVIGEHVSGTNLAARIGSDEFVLVLAGVDAVQAARIADELRAALTTEAPATPIRVSAGVVSLNGSRALSVDTALAAADVALTDAKRAGGDRTAVYGSSELTVLACTSRVRAAIANDRFVLYQQPILDLRRDVIKCHELLIRMLDDDGQLIPPANFVPLAERFGLIGEIDHWVLARGLQLATGGQRVTINLSAQSLSDRSIATVVRRAVDAGLDPRNVIFEVTETAAVEDAANASRLARELVQIGCDLALDDFGTGFGSFTNLKCFPARFVKIDAEFVRDVCSDENDRAIVRVISEIAHVLGKETIAEGVEDRETLEILRAQGVDHAQGYFIGRPGPIASRDATQRRDAP